VRILGTGLGTVTMPDTPAARHELDGSLTIDNQFGGGVSLGENIRTTGDAITINSPMTLTAALSLDTTNASPAGAHVTLGTVNGGAGTYALLLDGGNAGNITTGNLGVGNALGGLTITNAALVSVGSVTTDAGLSSTSDRFTATGAIESSGSPVSITAQEDNAGTVISLQGLDSHGQSVTLTSGDDIDLLGGADSITSSGGGGSLTIRGTTVATRIGIGNGGGGSGCITR